MADVDDNAVENQTLNNDEDEELTDSDNDNDGDSSFKINGSVVQKSEIDRLLKSHEPEDKEKLKELVVDIIEDDKYKVFQYLIDHEYIIDVLNSEGQTAVHIAFYDECQRINARLDKKSPIDSFDMMNQSNEILSLMLSANWMLEKSFNLEYVDCNGLTYLHIACFMCYDDLDQDDSLIKKCLNRKNVNAKFRDPNGRYGNFSPLHFAVINSSKDSADIVEELLMCKSKVNVRDWLGRTPLHLACQFYDCLELSFYLSNPREKLEEPCTLAPRIFDKQSTFYMKSIDAIDVLHRYGAMINARDNNGNTPLFSIFPEDYSEFSIFNHEWLDYSVPIIETTLKFAYLYEKGSNMTVKNKNGDTILHLITKNLRAYRESSEYEILLFDDAYHLEMIKHVLSSKKKVNVNARNKAGHTPIQWAVESLSIDVVQLLLDHGANLKYLEFDCPDDKLFSYEDVESHFKSVENLIKIIELLLTEDFDFTPDMTIKILKFVILQVDKCDEIGEIGEKHFIKTAFRRQVKKMCGNGMQELCSTLPDLCCDMVLNYLNNENIIDVYSIVNSLV